MTAADDQVELDIRPICEKCFCRRVPIQEQQGPVILHPSQWQLKVCGFCNQLKQLCRVVLVNADTGLPDQWTPRFPLGKRRQVLRL